MKIIKWVLGSMGLVLLVLALLFFYAYHQLDAPTIKNALTQAFAEKYQRPLLINGQWTPKLFPLGFRIESVRLGEPMTDPLANAESALDDGFLSIGDLEVALDTWALLEQRLIVRTLRINAVRVNIVRQKNGAFNFADLIDSADSANRFSSVAPDKPAKGGASLHWRIDRLVVSNATINYVDEKTLQKLRLTDINVALSDFAEGQAGLLKVQAEVQAEKIADFSSIQARLGGEGTIVVHPATQTFEGIDFALKVEGRANHRLGAITLDKLTTQMSINVSPTQMQAQMKSLALRAESKHQEDRIKIEGQMTSAKAVLLRNDSSALMGELQGISGTFAWQSSKHQLTGNFNQPQWTINTMEGKFGGSPTTATMHYRALSDLALQAQINVSIKGVLNQSWQAVKLSLSPIQMEGTAKMPSQAQAVPINLAAEIAIESMKTLTAEGSGKIADTQWTMKAQVPNLQSAPMNPQINVVADQINGDAWLPPVAASPSMAGNSAVSSPNVANEVAIDLSPLQNLVGQYTLKLGRLQVRNLTLQSIDLQMQGKGKTIVLSPLSFKIAEGTVRGGAHAQIASSTVALEAEVENINIATLLHDLQVSEILRGRANLAINLSTQGKNLREFKRALSGSIVMKATEGAIKGFNIAQSLREFQATRAILTGQSALDAKKQARAELDTDFATLSAKWSADAGVLSTRDLTMVSPYLRLLGEGSVNLPEETMALHTRVMLSSSAVGASAATEALQSKGIPLKVSGTFTDPHIAIDTAGVQALYLNAEKEKAQTMISTQEKVIKNQVQEKITKKKLQEQAKKALTNPLKGLFNRD